MILNDYDIISLESKLTVLEYVSESAKFEIDFGNDAYSAVYEEAAENIDTANTSWASKIANKIKMFAKSAIAKLKMILNQVVNKFRVLKAKHLSSKLIRGKYDEVGIFLESERIKAIMAKMGAYDNCLPDKVNNACMKFVDVIKNDKIPKSQEEFTKEYLKLKISKIASIAYFDLDFSDVKQYLDNSVSYLTALSKSTTDIKKCSDTLKQSGKSGSEIRYGISTMFNFLATSVKDYFKIAVHYANRFMKACDDVKKHPNKAVENDYHAKWRAEVEKAVESKDKKAFRNAVNVYTIGDDPMIKEAEDAVQYAIKNGLDPFVPHDDKIKINMNKSEWDTDYLATLQVSLYRNFSEKRFNHWKEVAEFVNKNQPHDTNENN